MFQNAKWIWYEEQSQPNERVSFFINKEIENLPSNALLHIGCETKYWLFVNGNLVVFDGGLFRESVNGCGYYDSVNIAPYLIKGNNEIALQVWYFGNGGRNNVRCERAGLIFACEELGLYSDKRTLCEKETAYYDTQTETPSYLYGGHNTAYNAKKKAFSLSPMNTCATEAVEIGKMGDAPWGDLLQRTVPLFYFGERVACAYQKQDEKYVVDLPYAMQCSPYIKISAEGGEVIDIRSDRFYVNGGPGDFNQYKGHRAEYVCQTGEQEFEPFDWYFGEKLYFTIPQSVKVIELGYRESGYACKITGSFACNDDALNRLFTKCARTLQICMRENFMDCPDRERGQWIGDVSVQAPQVIYLLDNNGLLLLRKTVLDFIRLRKGDVLMGNLPGEHFSELPSQSLNAVSEWGMISTYYTATKDKEILRLAFAPMMAYLKLWKTDKEGVVLPRKGNWEWYDHLFNCDKEVLNICWYYSALRFAEFTAKELEDETHLPFIKNRMTAIEKTFNDRYWKGGYYASGAFADDRANAMAVLSGLASQDKYEKIRFLLMSVFNATTYMEYYVLTALCEMGYKKDAIRRMKCRYQPLIENENGTLWEDFFHLGTKNHAWSGGPATVLFKYFGGVNLDYTLTETDIAPLSFVECSFTDKDGNEKTVVKR